MSMILMASLLVEKLQSRSVLSDKYDEIMDDMSELWALTTFETGKPYVKKSAQTSKSHFCANTNASSCCGGGKVQLFCWKDKECWEVSNVGCWNNSKMNPLRNGWEAQSILGFQSVILVAWKKLEKKLFITGGGGKRTTIDSIEETIQTSERCALKRFENIYSKYAKGAQKIYFSGHSMGSGYALALASHVGFEGHVVVTGPLPCSRYNCPRYKTMKVLQIFTGAMFSGEFILDVGNFNLERELGYDEVQAIGTEVIGWNVYNHNRCSKQEITLQKLEKENVTNVLAMKSEAMIQKHIHQFKWYKQCWSQLKQNSKTSKLL